MRARVLGLLFSAFAASVAAAGDIDSATWEPGTGADVALSSTAAVPIDSIVSGGVVILAGSYDTLVPEVTIAYAVDFGSHGWYDDRGKKFFVVPERYVKVSPDGSGGTNVDATIPLGWGPDFIYDLGETQSLHVFMGRPGIMVVDPATSVTNADDSAIYGVNSTEPARSLIPPAASVLDGITGAQTIHVTLFRPVTQSADEVYTLTFSGDAGLLEAMDLPPSVRIPAGSEVADILIEFNPRWSRHWPNTPNSLTLNAVSPLGSVNTDILFSGMTVGKLLSAAMSASWIWGTEDEEDCIRQASVVPPATPTDFKSPCTQRAPRCPVTETDHYIVYYPYECGLTGTCDEVQRVVTIESRKYTCDANVTCYWRPKGSIAVFKGTQCVCKSKQSGQMKTFSIPDCQ